MPTNNKNVGILIVVIVILILGGLYFNKSSTPILSTTPTNTVSSSTVPAENTPSTTKPTTILTSGNVAGYYSYANVPYKFSIQYPSYAKPLTSFATFHEIGNNWRLFPGQANQGKSVVSFSIHNIDQGSYSNGHQTYPLYFTSEVRVGVSPNVKECYALDAGYSNEKVVNVTINGIAFKRFSTSDAATMKYVQAESYRTIHNNLCYVIEQIKNGSTYRDEKMAMGTTDAQLENYYNLGEKIVKTFKFTK